MPKKNYSDLQLSFGKHLQEIRLNKGLSLRALSIRCDLDDSKISKIENGKLNIQLSTIIELAKGLDIDPRDLLDFS